MTPIFSNIEDFTTRTAIIDQNGRHYSYREIAALSDEQMSPLAQNRGLLILEASFEIESILAFIGACRASCPVLLAGEGKLDNNDDLRKRFRPDYEYRKSDNGHWSLTSGTSQPGKDLHPDLSVLLATTNGNSPKLAAKNLTISTSTDLNPFFSRRHVTSKKLDMSKTATAKTIFWALDSKNSTILLLTFSSNTLETPIILPNPGRSTRTNP